MIVDVHSHMLTRGAVPDDASPAQRLQANLDHFLRAQDESPVDFSVLSNPWLVESGLREDPARGYWMPPAAPTTYWPTWSRATRTALPAWRRSIRRVVSPSCASSSAR